MEYLPYRLQTWLQSGLWWLRHYGRKTLLDKTSTTTGTSSDDWDLLLGEYTLILYSRLSPLILNSQRGLHSLQVSTQENPSIKMKACMRGAIEIYFSDARVIVVSHSK